MKHKIYTLLDTCHDDSVTLEYLNGVAVKHGITDLSQIVVSWARDAVDYEGYASVWLEIHHVREETDEEEQARETKNKKLMIAAKKELETVKKEIERRGKARGCKGEAPTIALPMSVRDTDGLV